MVSSWISREDEGSKDEGEDEGTDRVERIWVYSRRHRHRCHRDFPLDRRRSQIHGCCSVFVELHVPRRRHGLVSHDRSNCAVNPRKGEVSGRKLLFEWFHVGRVLVDGHRGFSVPLLLRNVPPFDSFARYLEAWKKKIDRMKQVSN